MIQSETLEDTKEKTFKGRKEQYYVKNDALLTLRRQLRRSHDFLS